MRLGLLLPFLARLIPALAEDLLFLDTLHGKEWDQAIALGYTVKSVSEDIWRTMTTADFASYKAIVFADQVLSAMPPVIEETLAVWSPAILGHMVIIGTDPTLHFTTTGAPIMIQNSITFAASAVSPTSIPLTGLYFALSHYYDTAGVVPLTALSYFGTFTIQGQLGCYNKAHIVASHPSLATLTDADISNWYCSVHEAFVTYPTTGVNGFQPLAIAQDIILPGTQTFGDNSIGLPYIISRGATPLNCGNGVWEAVLGEECDDSNTINGDGCSSTCKCESGVANGDGTCGAPLPVCGNGVFEAGEECDDGNTADGDGCSATCKCEAPLIATGAGTCVTPQPVCGNGVLEADEECDDGNTAGGDGCSSTCKCEAPLIASGTGSCVNPPTTSNAPSSTTSKVSSSTKSSVKSTTTSSVKSTSSTKKNPTTTSSNHCRYVARRYETPSPYAGPKIIGVEVIVHVDILVSSEQSISTLKTLHRPIWDTYDPSRPDYLGEISAEGISYKPDPANFLTVTTTVCKGSDVTTTCLPVIKTCSTANPITLTAPAPWAHTPDPEEDTAFVAPIVEAHGHEQPAQKEKREEPLYGTSSPPQPTSTFSTVIAPNATLDVPVAAYTGGAKASTVTSAVVGLGVMLVAFSSVFLL